jgi:hypothetical protein
MKKLLIPIGIALISFFFTGCATTKLDIKNDAIKSLSDNPAGTYSDYGGKIEYNDKDKLYHLSVFVGGLGSCDNGAVLYAKPKLDEFMNANKFSSYKIIKGDYSVFPLGKCELFIQFDK